MKQITFDAQWLQRQLSMRHNAAVVTFDPKKPTVLEISVAGKFVHLPYTRIVAEAERLTTFHAIEKDVSRLMLLLIAAEGMTDLHHTYKPSKEFEDYWIKTNGRTT